MAQIVAKKNEAKVNVYYIHSILTILFMFGFGKLPALEPLTPLGMQTIGILLGFLYGWSTVGLAWPSLLGMIALSFSEILTMKEVLMAGFGNETIILIIFLLIFAAIVEEAGVSKHIAMWLITQKAFFGKPWLFTFVLLLAAFILSAATSTVAAIVICWGIVYKISSELGFQKGDKYPALIIIGVVYACTLGLCLFPFKSVPLGLLGLYQALSGVQVNFLSYVSFTFPICMSSLIGYTVLCKFVFRPDITPLANLNESIFDPNDIGQRFTKKQKVVVGFLLALIIMLLIPSILPSQWTITKILTDIGPVGTTILIVGVISFLQLDGKPLINFGKIASQGVQWEVVILTAAILPLAGVITAEATGVTPFLQGLLSPIFEGKPVMLFYIMVVFFTIVMTNLCNNGVTGMIFITLTYSFGASMDVNSTVLAIMIIYCVHLAIITPAASPMAAILHGNREWVTDKEIYKYGTIAALFTGVLLLVIGLPLASVLF